MAWFDSITDAIRKPDGTNIVQNVVGNALNAGSALRSTFLNPARAIDSIVGGASSLLQDTTKTSANIEAQLTNVIPNPLEKYASYAPLWTLACLTPAQFNNPASYRNSPNDLKYVVFSSAGRFDSNRVKTAYGSPEFFVNNFSMNAVISANTQTGNSNAIKFSFDIYEPYSMGLLLQSMQVAAVNAGYVNYLQNAPFVLRLDIQGYDDVGNIYTAVKPKFFTLKLVSCKFSVNEGGSTYKVEGIPWNHQGFADATNITYTDISISGTTGKGTAEGGFEPGTVGDLLVTGEKSLCRTINENEKRLVEEKKILFPDVYEIQFPDNTYEMFTGNPPLEEKKATVNPNAAEKKTILGTNLAPNLGGAGNYGNNPIGKSSFGFSQSSGGTFVPKRNGDVRDEKTGIVKRDKMAIDPKSRTFQFS